MHLQLSLLRSLPWLLAPALLAQAPPSPVPASPAASTAKALQAEFQALAKAVFPSVVTVRSFVRVPPTANGPAVPSTATPTAAAAAANGGSDPTPANGWVVPPDDREYPGFRLHRSGSGFLVAEGGEALSSLHALLRDDGTVADLVEIEAADGQRAICDVLGIEPTLQLAVVRAAVWQTHTPPPLPVLAFGDSDATDVGQFLLGCGDPIGPERFFAFGLLVAKPSRDCYQELMSATYMQATMAVPDGALGGPLVDLDGKVVGILSRLEGSVAGSVARSGPGSAWALPSKLLVGLHASIRAAGTQRSPWLGWSVMSRTEIAAMRGLKAWKAMAKPPHGILIENVFTPSPAATAGVRPGDFLTHFAGVEIHGPVDFQRQLYLNGVGRTVKVTMWRDGSSMALELPIEARPAAAVPR